MFKFKTMKVQNIIGYNGNEVRNQFIIENEEDNVVLFQSYSSPIVEIDRTNKIITIYPAWDYSTTTGKYRNKFLRDQGFSELADKKSLERYMSTGSYDTFTIVKAS